MELLLQYSLFSSKKRVSAWQAKVRASYCDKRWQKLHAIQV
jgi:hypothetical protein